MKKTRTLSHKSTLFIISLLLLALLTGCGNTGDSVEALEQNNQSDIELSEIPEEVSPLTLEKAEVVRVVDGDTAIVRLEDGTDERVRFIGINTPESTTRHEPYGEEASAFTTSKLDGKTVYLEKDVSERDKYNRLLRYIWLEPPTEVSEDSIRANMFNAILLLEGYAQVATYPPDVKYTEDYFLDFQAEARGAEKGLWKPEPAPEPEPVKEVETTTATPEQETYSASSPASDTQETVYITKTGSKYHCGYCQHLKKSKIPISLSEAKARYGPCKTCGPPR